MVTSVELRSPGEPAQMRTRTAAVVTHNRFVFNDCGTTLRRMGIAKVLHLTPQKLIDGPIDFFWVIDGRLPGSLELIRMLLAVGRSNGIALSTPFDHRFNTQCARAGVPALLMHRAVEMAEPESDSPIRLSQREILVVQLVAEGKTNQGIGAALGISALTVKSHLSRISRRAGANDRANLVYRCLRAGVIH